MRKAMKLDDEQLMDVNGGAEQFPIAPNTDVKVRNIREAEYSLPEPGCDSFSGSLKKAQK